MACDKHFRDVLEQLGKLAVLVGTMKSGADSPDVKQALYQGHLRYSDAKRELNGCGDCRTLWQQYADDSQAETPG